MRLTIAFFLATLALFGQAREMVLCDNQSPRNCFSWDIGANLGGGLSISGPVLPTNGETSGAGRGTMTGHMLLAGGFDNAGTIKLGSNIDALPDTTGIYGAAQSGNDCTFPPAWSSSTTYNIGDIAFLAGVTYTSIASGNLNHIPPNASFWTAGCVDDRTRVDWLGFEGAFFRIKAHGSGNTEIGDYFDWTRYGATNALPVHQVNLQDSSFNVLIHIDEDSNFRFTDFDYSGEIRFGLNSVTGVATGITQNANGIVEINNGVPLANAGVAAQLRMLGALVNQDNDSSGYQIQSNGGIEMTSLTGNILSKGFVTNAISAPNGGMIAGYSTTDLSLITGAYVGTEFEAITASINASVAGLSVVAGTAVLITSGRTGTGTFLPMEFLTNGFERMRINTTGQLLINRTTDDGTSSILETSGSISASGNIIAGIAYQIGGNVVINNSLQFVGSGGVFTSGSGTFNGDVGTNGKFNVGANNGQTATLTASGTCSITVTGGVITGHTGC